MFLFCFFCFFIFWRSLNFISCLLMLIFGGLHQRWSRGHKAQGKGHKKIRGQGQRQPFRGQNPWMPRTEMLEAKAKDSPSKDRPPGGQGQKCSRPRPRTKDTGASVLQNKSLQENFSGDLQKNAFKIFFQAMFKRGIQKRSS